MGFTKGRPKNVGKASLKPNNVDSQAIWLRGQDIAARNGLLYSAETLQTMDTLHETKSMDNIIDHLSVGRKFEENITSNLKIFCKLLENINVSKIARMPGWLFTDFHFLI